MASIVGGALKRALRRREQQLFLGGAASLVFVTAVAPLVRLVVDIPGSSGAVLEVLGAARTWALLFRSLLLAAGVSLTALAIGVPLGLLVGRTDVPFRRALWLVHAFPMFLPPFLPALGWFHWLGAEGIVGNQATARLLFSAPGLVLVLGATFAPLVTSLVALAVSNVDDSLQEAARVVARPIRVAARVLLPAASPAIALSAVVVFALAVSELGVPMLLRVDVFPAAVFARLGGIDFAPAEALALTLPLVPVALVLVLLERRYAGSRFYAVLGMRTARGAALPLGKWRAAATVGCAAGAALSAAPIGALALRASGVPASQTGLLGWAREAPLNGMVAGTAAATLITAIALIGGHAAARRLRGGVILDAVCLLVFLTPSAVLGIGIIGLWNRDSTQFVYGTPAVLVVGYVARYAAVGMRVMAAAVAQSPVHLEEAAQSFGASFGRRLLAIVAPLHARGLAFAWLGALIFCLRDLETAVLFYPPGREPLAVRIFTLEANGPPAVVAGLATLHIVMTAAVVCLGVLLLRRREA